MSVSTPTLTTPSETCAAAGPAAKTARARVRAAVKTAVGARFRLVRAIGPPFLRVGRCDGPQMPSDAKESMERLLAPLQPGARDHIDDAAMLDQVVAGRERRVEPGILLEQVRVEVLLRERRQPG